MKFLLSYWPQNDKFRDEFWKIFGTTTACCTYPNVEKLLLYFGWSEHRVQRFKPVLGTSGSQYIVDGRVEGFWVTVRSEFTGGLGCTIDSYSDVEQLLELCLVIAEKRQNNPMAKPWHHAAKLNNHRLLKIFLDDPACDVAALCSNGKTVLDWALEAGSKESIEILQTHPKQRAFLAAKAKADAEARAKADAEARAEAEAKAKQAKAEAMARQAQINFIEMVVGPKLQKQQDELTKLRQLIQEQMPWLKLDVDNAIALQPALKISTPDLQPFYQADANLPDTQSPLFTFRENSSVVEIPDYFCCPISHQLMSEPVITNTGMTYEREELEKHMLKNNLDPNEMDSRT